MNEDVFIMAIIFGSVISIVFLGVMGSILKAWVESRKKNSLLSDPDFMDALREFKQKTDHRLSDIETILSENNLSKPVQGRKEQKKTIKLPDSDDSLKKTGYENPPAEKLRNMLKDE